jgi:hypothetical protein
VGFEANPLATFASLVRGIAVTRCFMSDGRMGSPAGQSNLVWETPLARERQGDP